MKYLYVCNTSSDSISIVKLDSFQEECKITLTSTYMDRIGPHGICLYKGNLLIANNYSNNLSLVNLEKRQLQENYFIGMNCNDVKVVGDSAFVICGDSNYIVNYDMIENRILEEIPCGSMPHSIDIFKPNRILLTADMDSDSITICDSSNKEDIKTIRVGNYPTKAIFTVDGSYILVCESNIGSDQPGSISIISYKNLKLLYRIIVGNAPVDMYCENNYCFVSNFGDGTISIVDISKRLEVKRIELGGMPRGIIKNKDDIYVGDNYNNLLFKINESKEEKKAISIGGEPTGMILC